jgi:hypothetical protein
MKAKYQNQWFNVKDDNKNSKYVTLEGYGYVKRVLKEDVVFDTPKEKPLKQTHDIKEVKETPDKSIKETFNTPKDLKEDIAIDPNIAQKIAQLKQDIAKKEEEISKLQAKGFKNSQQQQQKIANQPLMEDGEWKIIEDDLGFYVVSTKDPNIKHGPFDDKLAADQFVAQADNESQWEEKGLNFKADPKVCQVSECQTTMDPKMFDKYKQNNVKVASESHEDVKQDNFDLLRKHFKNLLEDLENINKTPIHFNPDVESDDVNYNDLDNHYDNLDADDTSFKPKGVITEDDEKQLIEKKISIKQNNLGKWGWFQYGATDDIINQSSIPFESEMEALEEVRQKFISMDDITPPKSINQVRDENEEELIDDDPTNHDEIDQAEQNYLDKRVKDVHKMFVDMEKDGLIKIRKEGVYVNPEIFGPEYTPSDTVKDQYGDVWQLFTNPIEVERMMELWKADYPPVLAEDTNDPKSMLINNNISVYQLESGKFGWKKLDDNGNPIKTSQPFDSEEDAIQDASKSLDPITEEGGTASVAGPGVADGTTNQAINATQGIAPVYSRIGTTKSRLNEMFKVDVPLVLNESAPNLNRHLIAEKIENQIDPLNESEGCSMCDRNSARKKAIGPYATLKECAKFLSENFYSCSTKKYEHRQKPLDENLILEQMKKLSNQLLRKIKK